MQRGLSPKATGGLSFSQSLHRKRSPSLYTREAFLDLILQTYCLQARNFYVRNFVGKNIFYAVVFLEEIVYTLIIDSYTR